MPKPTAVDLLLADVALGKRKDSEVALEILGELVKSEQTSSPRRYVAGVWAIGILSKFEVPAGKVLLDSARWTRIGEIVKARPGADSADVFDRINRLATYRDVFEGVTKLLADDDRLDETFSDADIVSAVGELIAEAKGRAQVEADVAEANAEVDRELATLRATVNTQADRIEVLESESANLRTVKSNAEARMRDLEARIDELKGELGQNRPEEPGPIERPHDPPEPPPVRMIEGAELLDQVRGPIPPKPQIKPWPFEDMTPELALEIARLIVQPSPNEARIRAVAAELGYVYRPCRLGGRVPVREGGDGR